DLLARGMARSREDARLYDRARCVVSEKPTRVEALGAERASEVPPGLVPADAPHEPRTAAERSCVHRCVRRPTWHAALLLEVEDQDRGLARDAGRAADPVAVEHEIADHRDRHAAKGREELEKSIAIRGRAHGLATRAGRPRSERAHRRALDAARSASRERAQRSAAAIDSS